MKIRALLVLCLVWSVTAFAGDAISLRADRWEPFNGDPAAAKPGYMIEVARVVFEKAGYTVDYQNETWERSIEEVGKGTIDGIIGVSPGEAEEIILPTEKLGQAEMMLFVKKGNPWRYTGVDSLANIRLGVIGGYDYEDQIDQYIEAHKNDDAAVQAMIDENALELNMRKLQAGRIDAIVEEKHVFESKAADLGLAGQFDEAGTADSEPVYIGFSGLKDTSQKYADLLSQGVKELRTSGELQRILDKYSLKDWASE